MNGPIAVIDYGLGNLRSVRGAISKLGFEAIVSADAGELGRATSPAEDCSPRSTVWYWKNGSRFWGSVLAPN